MAKTKLFLRASKTNSKGESIIFVRYSHGDQATDISTGERVPPKFWDPENQRVRKSYAGFTGINNFIEKKKLQVDQIRIDLKDRKIDPTVDALKNEYLRRENPVVEEPQKIISQNILDHWDRFISYQRDVKRRAPATIAQYESSKLVIEAFEKHIDMQLTFSMITKSFADDYYKFMYLEKKYAHNTLGSRVKHLKSFLNFCVSEGITDNHKFREFKKPSNQTSIFALSREQLDILNALDLSNEKRLERARDLFVFGCSTGLRFSDYSKVKQANVQGDYLIVRTEKMDDIVRIPLNTYSRSILAKYPSGIPTISNVNLNKYLKEIGIKAKFFEEVEVVTYKSGVRTKSTKPIYMMLTTHCARRSYITQSLQNGMAMQTVMKISSHRDIKSFNRYIHVSEPRLKMESDQAWSTLPENKE
ncbi:MAG: site-specific integrase [Cyclobacteriaceae bacterium]